MADLSFEAFQNNNKKTASSGGKDLSYDAFSAIQTGRNDRIAQGLPVSNNDNKVAPSFLGSIIRGALKPIVRTAITPATNKTIKSNYFGDIAPVGIAGQKKLDEIKASGRQPTKKEILSSMGTDLKDIFGTGIEVASNIPVAKGVSTAAGASKLGVKEFLKQSGKSLAIEGATQGALQSTGSQMQDNALKGTKFSVPEVLKSAAIGAVVAPVLGTGINAVFGRAGKKASSNVGKELPRVGTPTTPTTPEMLALPAPKQPVYLPIRSGVDFYAGPNGISADKKLAGQGAKKLTQQQLDRIENAKPVYDTADGNLYTPYEQLPVITADSRVRVPKNEFNVTKDNSKQTVTGKPELQPSVKADSVPNVNTGDVTLPKTDPGTGLPVKETPQTKEPVINSKQSQVEAPVQSSPETIKEGTDALKKYSPEITIDNTTSNKIDSFNADIQSNPELAQKYASGEILHPKGEAYNTAYNALIKNYASKTNNAALIDIVSDPSFNKIGTRAGQNLGSLNLIERGTIADVLTNIKKTIYTKFEKTVGKDTAKHFDQFNKDFMAKVEQFGGTPTIKELKVIADKLICPR